jgi:hypothetical protein
MMQGFLPYVYAHGLLHGETYNPLQGAGQISINFVWIALAAAVICLFSSFICLPWLTAPFAEDVATSFSQLRLVLEQHISDAACDGLDHADKNSARKVPTAQALLQRSIQLNASYAQAAFEIRIGRLNGMPRARYHRYASEAPAK